MSKKMIEPCLGKDGYLYVSLTDKNGVTKQHPLHMIVAETFVPNPNNLKNVRHKDGDKLNNKADNLEWY